MPSGLPSWRTDRRKTAERGYGGRWQLARELFLQLNSRCVMCLAERPTPRITRARVVDHIIPHHGDPVLMWDVTNWQALCVRHHSGDKQVLEKTGRVVRRIGLDGFPIVDDEG